MKRHVLPLGAPTAVGLRREYRELGELLDADYEHQVLNVLPRFDYATAGIEPTDVVAAASAWPGLDQLHSALVERCQAVVDRRGSAEWLWWLRRLRGQFHLNRFDSTDPYVQALAETLAAGSSRPSIPAQSQTYEYPFEPEVLLDLLLLRHFAIATYRLHTTMKRCAKGQDVRFIEDDIPDAVIDDILEPAILEYDLRVQRAGGSLLDAVGLHAVFDELPKFDDQHGFGGLVPFWWFTSVPRGEGIINEADPRPMQLQFLNLNNVEPLIRTRILTKEHVALIALLHAAYNIITREPEHRRKRSQAPIQWGYMVTPTDNVLRPALDEALTWMRNHPAPAIPRASVPGEANEVFDVLSSLPRSVLPPYCGNPIHQADPHTVIDLTGASHRLFETLVRPVDGADVNFWSQQFEQDVQNLIDESAWRPTGAFRNLIGRKIRRADGSNLTDIDAVGLKGSQLLVLSCKSVAAGPALMGGDHAAVRNFREKAEGASHYWMSIVRELRVEPTLLGVPDAHSLTITGLVVFPAVPFLVDPEVRDATPPFDGPYALSSSELRHALATE